jgi:hypothetical protein
VGSIGEASLRYLGNRGRVASKDLATAIDTDHGSMHASLNLCVTNGLITRHVEDDVTYYWLPVVTKPPAVEAVKTVEAPQQVQAAAAPEPQRFEIGVFSDGRLVMEYGDEQLTLTRAERVKLLTFLSAHKEPA